MEHIKASGQTVNYDKFNLDKIFSYNYLPNILDFKYYII